MQQNITVTRGDSKQEAGIRYTWRAQLRRQGKRINLGVNVAMTMGGIEARTCEETLHT